MTAPGFLQIGATAVVTAGVLLSAPVSTPVATADQCADVEVVFARGTNEPPGLGFLGQVFADSLGAQLPGRSFAVYAVNYPASDDYLTSAAAGTDDASAHIENIVAGCPNTKIVLGGYSQGAAVTELSTSAMPPAVADHVAAVALFGRPSSAYSNSLVGGAPLPTISPLYAAKTIDLCIPDDPICSAGNNMMAHVSYIPSGLANQAATFAAERLGPTA
jgi:cutinase